MSLHSDFSLRMGAIILGLLCSQTLSKQAFWKKVNFKSVAFFRETLAAAIATMAISGRSVIQGNLSAFKRLLIQDSSKIPLPVKFAHFYPGARNQTGRQSATLSIQAIYDCLGENFVSFALTPFTRNDQKAATDIVAIAQKGDLILRDLGYFSLESLRQIDARDAHYITRHRHGTSVYDLESNPIELLKKLRQYRALDIPVLFGQKVRLRARLVATPVPDPVANQRRRKLLQQRDRRLNPSKEHLALLGWEIFLTNVSPEILSADAVCSLYGLRWRVEIVFKSWKSHFSFATTTDGTREYLESLLYARLIYITLFQTSWFRELQLRVHASNGKNLSLLKTAQLFAHLSWLLSLVPPHREFWKAVLEQVIAHCIYEQRRTRLNYQQMLASLRPLLS